MVTKYPGWSSIKGVKEGAVQQEQCTSGRAPLRSQRNSLSQVALGVTGKNTITIKKTIIDNNNNMFNTEDYQKQMLARSPALVALETAVQIVIILTALLGNLMVCLAVYRSKKLRTVPNLYIVALAILDILMAVICMPLSAEVFVTGNFPHGKHVAHLQGSFAFFLPIASLQLMTAMAVNRFYRIVKPEMFRKHFSLRRTVLSLVIIMILGALGPCLPLIFGFAKYDFHYGKVLSYLNYATPIAAYFYTIFLKIFYIAVPALVTLICYYRIFAKVKSHTKELTANQQNNHSSGRLSMNVEEINITKPLFAAVLGFVACWTPVAAVDMIDTFSHHTIHHAREVYLFYLLMGYASSSINPFIYGLLNRSFKQEFIKIFRVIFRRRTEPMQQVGAVTVRALAFRGDQSSMIKLGFTSSSG